jgi:uncharacterized small protein (DUF1192 family)
MQDEFELMKKEAMNNGVSGDATMEQLLLHAKVKSMFEQLVGARDALRLHVDELKERIAIMRVEHEKTNEARGNQENQEDRIRSRHDEKAQTFLCEQSLANIADAKGEEDRRCKDDDDGDGDAGNDKQDPLEQLLASVGNNAVVSQLHTNLARAIETERALQDRLDNNQQTLRYVLDQARVQQRCVDEWQQVYGGVGEQLEHMNSIRASVAQVEQRHANVDSQLGDALQQHHRQQAIDAQHRHIIESLRKHARALQFKVDAARSDAATVKFSLVGLEKRHKALRLHIDRSSVSEES